MGDSSQRRGLPPTSQKEQHMIHINLRPDPPILHAVQLGALIDHYLGEQSRRVQRKTVVGYRRKLAHFRRWWEQEGPRRGWCLDELALREFDAHLRAVRSEWGRPLGWHSRNDVKRRLRQVFRWAHSRGYITVDFAQFVPGEKGNPAPKLPVALDTLAVLLDACEATNEPIRNRAIIAVLAGTGMRAEECAALRVEQVTIYRDGSGYVRLSVAKNDKLRMVAFDTATGSHLRLWIDQLDYVNGPLFPSRKGRSARPRSLSPSGLHKILVTIAEAAGARHELRGAHDFRRLFATAWHRVQPAAIRLLQKQLGHSSIETTMLYVLDSDEETRELIQRTPVTPMAQLSLLKESSH